MKKFAADVIILHLCTKNHNCMSRMTMGAGKAGKAIKMVILRNWAGKAGKQVHFLVWKAGKAGVSIMFN